MLYATYDDADEITPSDGADLAKPTAAIYVGGAGTVTVITRNGTEVSFTAPAGARIPVSAKRVKATGTSATLLVGLYFD